MTMLGAAGDAALAVTVLAGLTTIILWIFSQPHDGDSLEISQVKSIDWPPRLSRDPYIAC